MSQRHADFLSDAQHVLEAYALTGATLVPLTSGLINLTWKVERNRSCWVLQRLHASMPREVNLNLRVITDYLAAHGTVTPRLVQPEQHADCVSEAGAIWRLLTYVDGMSFATLPDLAHARSAGSLLGRFHAALADFPIALPYARTPVHEPARHIQFLQETLSAHSPHRLHAEVATLASEALAALAEVPPVALEPLRLVHGDPKLSNLLFGADAAPLCMVDLDTLTRAPLAYELGDALRSWCNPYPEDATTPRFSMELFDAALAGYAETAGALLLPPEINSIVAATETIYLELTTRFAADALNESYFGWDDTRFASRGEHNLQRARNQLQCAKQVRSSRLELTALVTARFAGQSR